MKVKFILTCRPWQLQCYVVSFRHFVSEWSWSGWKGLSIGCVFVFLRYCLYITLSQTYNEELSKDPVALGELRLGHLTSNNNNANGMHSMQCCFSVSCMMKWIMLMSYKWDLSSGSTHFCLVFYIIVLQKNLTELELTRLSSTLSLLLIRVSDSKTAVNGESNPEFC